MRFAIAILLITAAFAGCAEAPQSSFTPSADSILTVESTDSIPAVNETPVMETPAPTEIGHVFIIILENNGYETNFGNDIQSDYLGHKLPAMGALLTQYYGIGHASLDNYIAMVSGQAPNPQTQGDCFLYDDFVGLPGLDEDGQAVGTGCVYPTEVLTVGDQMTAANLTWKSYAEDMAKAEPSTCRHQAANTRDDWQGTNGDDNYATRHVPFVFFHSVIDDQPYCDEHVVDLEELRTDLNGSTPQYVFITPDTCSDGHDATCSDPDQAGGYDGIEAFLSEWIPLIMNSTAFDDGLILVTFDEAGVDDASACCGEPSGPNTPSPGIAGPGGGVTGGVLISPCIEPGTVDDTGYNHYSMLRTVEDIFGLEHLGYAGMDGLVPFDLGTCNP